MDKMDGFDGVLFCYDPKSFELSYTAANNKPVLIRNNELQILADDRMPVGKGEKTQSFNLHTIQIQAGDYLYLYTDGFADQFGGMKGKKFKYKQLHSMLIANSAEPMERQKEILSNTFEVWKGNLEQVDDVLFNWNQNIGRCCFFVKFVLLNIKQPHEKIFYFRIRSYYFICWSSNSNHKRWFRNVG